MKTLMNIEKILKNRRLCSALIGITPDEFKQLLVLFTNTLLHIQSSKKRTRKVGGGRNGNIKTPTQKLFYILFYVKCYPTNDMSAFIFGSSKTRTQIWNQNILPILEKTLGYACVLPVRHLSSVEEFYALFPGVKEVMIDGIERPIQRPRKDKPQKKHYSGKKKRHTRKNNIIVNKKKEILMLSPTKHGKVHDKKLSDKFLMTEHIPESVNLLADSGFTGIPKIHNNTLIPKKKTKTKPLTLKDKAMNRLISSSRIVVENAIAGIKKLRSLSDVFRGKNGSDDTLMLIGCGLWNFHIKFTG
jgi:transposase